MTRSDRGGGDRPVRGIRQATRTQLPTAAVSVDAFHLTKLAAAWGIKEQLWRLLACSSLTDAHEEKKRLGHYAQVADMPDTDRLWATVRQWWPAIEFLIVTGVTNAKIEAANTGIKNINASADASEREELPGAYSAYQRPPEVRHEHIAQRTHFHAEPRRAALSVTEFQMSAVRQGPWGQIELTEPDPNSPANRLSETCRKVSAQVSGLRDDDTAEIL